MRLKVRASIPASVHGKVNELQDMRILYGFSHKNHEFKDDDLKYFIAV